MFVALRKEFESELLCDLFDKSLFSGSFPNDWKTARVAPMFKEGHREDRSNYRATSGVPVLSWLFEKLIYNQLYDYLDKDKLIYRHQSALRSRHSVVTCLLANKNDW